MDQNAIERLAGELSTAWETRTPVTPSLVPANLEEAYQAQARLVEKIGAGVGPKAGYKVGYTNRVLQ